MDGTFMKEVFDQIDLFAVTADADNHLVPFAWAIVENESEVHGGTSRHTLRQPAHALIVKIRL
jgi:hypothetical protein